jgi:hypothetical protein
VQGTLSEHHRFLLRSQLRQLDCYDTQIGELDQEIARRLGFQRELDPEDPDPDPSHGGPTSGQPAPSARQAWDGTQACGPSSPEPSSTLARSQADVLRVLDEVTGINQRIAEIVLAELGTRLAQFPSAGIWSPGSGYALPPRLARANN